MKIINTFYLIDYENVNSNGLVGCDKLTKLDHIIIFFTRNAMKINMCDIANHGYAELDMIEIPPGKQSVDIHIGSYLGYLIGSNDARQCKIVIISKDTDFDNIIKFWKLNMGVKICRVEQIKALISKATKVKQPIIFKCNKIDKDSANKKSFNDTKNKTAVNNEIMSILSKTGFDNKTINYVASTVVKNIDVENRKQQIYRTITFKYGQNKGLNIYNQIKKVI